MKLHIFAKCLLCLMVFLGCNVRNYLQRSEDFNNRIITRRQGNLEGAPDFGGGMMNDIPNPPSNALRILEDYLCFKDRLEPRGGSKVWSNTTLPALVGRTGYALTKSGTTVTKTAGTNFSSSDVGNYIVYDDGVHERISAYISTTKVTVEVSTAHAASTAAWIHGPLNMVAYHKKNSRIVIQIDTRFFISSTLAIGAWYQIFRSGSTDPADSHSTWDEMGDYLMVGNANGIFKLDCAATGDGSDPCIFFQVNSTVPTVTSTDTDEFIYQFRYITALSRIKGTAYNRNRNTNALEIQSAPLNRTNGVNDFYFVSHPTPPEDGNINPYFYFNTDLYQYTHLSIYRTLDIGVNGIDPQTGSGNNKELYVHVYDKPILRAFRGSKTGTTLTSATPVFDNDDKYNKLVDEAGNIYDITDVNSSTEVTTIQNGVVAETSFSIRYSGTIPVRTASQAISGSETIGNATITKTGGPDFSSSDVGKEAVWAGDKRSLIVKYLTTATVEVAQSEAISSTAMVCNADAVIEYSFLDETSDDTLRRLAAGYSLKNRFMVAMPDCDVIQLTGGMLWGAIRGAGNIYYSQVPNNEEYYAGYYRPSGDGAQIDNLPDTIQAASVFGDRIVWYCSQSSWYIPTNDYYTVTLPEVGEVVVVATGHYPLGEIGVKDYGSIRRVAGVKFSDLQETLGDVMVCHDGGVRICSGSTFSGNLAIDRVTKLLQSQAVRSAATYDSINGYLLWRSDDTRNDATHGYGFGIEPSVQGVGWHKIVNGDPIFPFARMGGIVVLDSNGHFRSLVLDSRKGLFYEIATRTGPSGSGLTKLWKDKVATDGTGGTDVAPAVEFIPEGGTEDYFQVEHKESHIGTRPYSETDGYASGLAFTLKIYKGTDTTATAQTVSVTKDTDIVFDKKVISNQLRIRLESNKSGHVLTSRVNKFLAMDKGATPTNRTSAEQGYQKSLSNTLLWVDTWKGEKVINRTIGTVIDSAPTLITGPDERTTGIYIDTILTCPSISITSRTIFYWTNQLGYGLVSIGGIAIEDFTTYDSIGDWYLIYKTVTGSGVITIEASPFAFSIFDFRVFNEELSSEAIEYYFNDVRDNSGKVVIAR